MSVSLIQEGFKQPTTHYHWLLQELPLFVSHVTIYYWPTPSTTFHHSTSANLFNDLLRQYPLSIKYPTKPEISNPSHHLHLILPHPSVSWLCYIKNVLNSYYSCCLSSKHYQKLRSGFQLTHNHLFCEHILLSEYYPGNTFCPNLQSILTTKTNNFSFWLYSSYLISIWPTNENQLLV